MRAMHSISLEFLVTPFYYYVSTLIPWACMEEEVPVLSQGKKFFTHPSTYPQVLRRAERRPVVCLSQREMFFRNTLLGLLSWQFLLFSTVGSTIPSQTPNSIPSPISVPPSENFVSLHLIIRRSTY